MRIIKRIFKILGITIALLIIIVATLVYTTSPSLPEGANDVISKVINRPLPELVKGKAGFVNSNGVRIWYEFINPHNPPKGTVLLIMGISSDALAWPQDFLKKILAAGYQIVRFDNRDTGMSDWGNNDYTIRDMASDGIAILDALNIEQAHILGISMGGMIAQQIAIDYPNRAQSLISGMSSAYIMDPELSRMPTKMITDFIKLGLRYGILGGERNNAKLQITSRELLKGSDDYQLNFEEIATQVIYNIRRRKGLNYNATQSQQKAILSGGSRYEKLSSADIPTLLFHGKNDPIMPFGHGLKMSKIMPDADTLWLDGMGHDIPEKFMKTIVEKIINHLDMFEQY